MLSEAESLYGISIPKEEQPFFASRFEKLLKRAYQQTGQQVVILVDEYDKPLLQTMGVNEVLNEDYRNTLKAFYSVIKTCDEYIRFAFLTGVTKFSKISIFSDLNNLRDISVSTKSKLVVKTIHGCIVLTMLPGALTVLCKQRMPSTFSSLSLPLPAVRRKQSHK